MQFINKKDKFSPMEGIVRRVIHKLAPIAQYQILITMNDSDSEEISPDEYSNNKKQQNKLEAKMRSLNFDKMTKQDVNLYGGRFQSGLPQPLPDRRSRHRNIIGDQFRLIQLLSGRSFFGKYGPVESIRFQYNQEENSYAYVTYTSVVGAALAIQVYLLISSALDRLRIGKKRIIAKYGTNKYCYSMINKGRKCSVENCSFFHERQADDQVLVSQRRNYEWEDRRLKYLENNIQQVDDLELMQQANEAVEKDLCPQEKQIASRLPKFPAVKSILQILVSEREFNKAIYQRQLMRRKNQSVDTSSEGGESAEITESQTIQKVKGEQVSVVSSIIRELSLKRYQSRLYFMKPKMMEDRINVETVKEVREIIKKSLLLNNNL